MSTIAAPASRACSAAATAAVAGERRASVIERVGCAVDDRHDDQLVGGTRGRPSAAVFAEPLELRTAEVQEQWAILPVSLRRRAIRECDLGTEVAEEEEAFVFEHEGKTQPWRWIKQGAVEDAQSRPAGEQRGDRQGQLVQIAGHRDLG